MIRRLVCWMKNGQRSLVDVFAAAIGWTGETWRAAMRLSVAAEYRTPVLLLVWRDPIRQDRLSMRLIPGLSVQYQQWGVWITMTALLVHAALHPVGTMDDETAMRPAMSLWFLGTCLFYAAPRIQTVLNQFLGILQNILIGSTGWQHFLARTRKKVRDSLVPTMLVYPLAYTCLLAPVADRVGLWVCADFSVHALDKALAPLLIALLASIIPPLLLYATLPTTHFDTMRAPGDALDDPPHPPDHYTARQRPGPRDLDAVERSVHVTIDRGVRRYFMYYLWELVKQSIAPTRARTSIASTATKQSVRDALSRLILLKELHSPAGQVQQIILFLYPTLGGYLVLLWAFVHGGFPKSSLIAAAGVWAVYTVIVILWFCHTLPRRLALDRVALSILPSFLAPSYEDWLSRFREEAVYALVSRLLMGSIPLILSVLLIGFLTMLDPTDWPEVPSISAETAYFRIPAQSCEAACNAVE